MDTLMVIGALPLLVQLLMDLYSVLTRARRRDRAAGVNAARRRRISP